MLKDALFFRDVGQGKKKKNLLGRKMYYTGAYQQDSTVLLYSSFMIDECIILSRIFKSLQFSSKHFNTVKARFPTRTVCPVILSELFGRPTGLRGNALVSDRTPLALTLRKLSL